MQTQKEWIKSHKKDFANKLIAKSGATRTENPAAIFMAGLPGAGKTEFTKHLIKKAQLKVVRLDMDEIATCVEGYRPEVADKYRSGATELLNKSLDLVLKNKLSFIMDGTFSSKYGIRNVNRAIAHGYMVKIIYIAQDPRTAWHFTLAREKVEHRAIDEDGFIRSYFGTLDNIKVLLASKHDKIAIDVVVKQPDNEIGELFENVALDKIDKIIKIYYKYKEIKDYIDDRQNQTQANEK